MVELERELQSLELNESRAFVPENSGGDDPKLWLWMEEDLAAEGIPGVEHWKAGSGLWMLNLWIS